jgi:hypothetical protein
LPPPAPIIPTSAPSVLIPPSTADGTQASNNNDDDDDSGENPLLAQIRNFAKSSKLKAASKSNAVEEAPLPNSNEQESIMDSLKKRLVQRRGFITGETSSTSASADKPIAAPTPPPSTGGAFTDAIAAKAKEIADEQQRRKDDSESDGGDDDNWE